MRLISANRHLSLPPLHFTELISGDLRGILIMMMYWWWLLFRHRLFLSRCRPVEENWQGFWIRGLLAQPTARPTSLTLSFCISAPIPELWKSEMPPSKKTIMVRWTTRNLNLCLAFFHFGVVSVDASPKNTKVSGFWVLFVRTEDMRFEKFPQKSSVLYVFLLGEQSFPIPQTLLSYVLIKSFFLSQKDCKHIF